jgi:hypothetical protein
MQQQGRRAAHRNRRPRSLVPLGSDHRQEARRRGVPLASGQWLQPPPHRALPVLGRLDGHEGRERRSLGPTRQPHERTSPPHDARTPRLLSRRARQGHLDRSAAGRCDRVLVVSAAHDDAQHDGFLSPGLRRGVHAHDRHGSRSRSSVGSRSPRKEDRAAASWTNIRPIPKQTAAVTHEAHGGRAGADAGSGCGIACAASRSAKASGRRFRSWRAGGISGAATPCR